MSTPRITFADEVGSASLNNGKPAPANRFSNWVPVKAPVGDSAWRLADEQLTIVRTSWRYGATFELRGIPQSTVGGVRMVDVAARLIAHLKNGGQCSVGTGDVFDTSYAICGLMKGTEPQLTLSNASLLEYTLTIALTNQAATPVLMSCYYASTTGS